MCAPLCEKEEKQKTRRQKRKRTFDVELLIYAPRLKCFLLIISFLILSLSVFFWLTVKVHIVDAFIELTSTHAAKSVGALSAIAINRIVYYPQILQAFCFSRQLNRECPFAEEQLRLSRCWVMTTRRIDHYVLYIHPLPYRRDEINCYSIRYANACSTQILACALFSFRDPSIIIHFQENCWSYRRVFDIWYFILLTTMGTVYRTERSIHGQWRLSSRFLLHISLR